MLIWKPLLSPHGPCDATYLWVCVDFRVLLGTQEWEEEEAVTASQGELPPVRHGQGQVHHDLSGDEGRSCEPEALTQHAVCAGQGQGRVSSCPLRHSNATPSSRFTEEDEEAWKGSVTCPPFHREAEKATS